MPNRLHHTAAALAHALFCTEQDADRRTEARYPTQDPAELQVLPCPSEPIYGTILDVSRSGMRAALPKRLDRGQQVRVQLHNNVIFGEVRYCRAVSGVFHIGIRIQEVVRPAQPENEHIADDPLSLYAVGKGLSVPEVIQVREHLVRCEACRTRLAQREALLNPSRRARPGRPLV